MTDYADFHVHSTASDGTLTPTQLVEYAIQKGLRAFALSDHDTTAGVDEALSAAKGTGLEVIPALEFSTNYHEKDIHMLGLAVRYDDPEFQKELAAFQDSREVRNVKMIRKLQEHGVDITYEKMAAENPDSVWTRGNFGRYLLKHHYVKSVAEAFSVYIGENCPCFVPREKVTPFDALKLIHKYDGYAVLAHPISYHLPDDKLEQLVKELKEAGLDGIEALYSTHQWFDETNVKKLARKYQLCITGGSDFHGAVKPDIDLGCGRGNLKIPYSLWTDLQAGKFYT